MDFILDILQIGKEAKFSRFQFALNREDAPVQIKNEHFYLHVALSGH